MKKFKLELAEDKPRIIPFGRFKGNDESFNFLGFTISNGKTTNEKYRPNIKTNKKKLKQKFEVVKKWLYDNMHTPILEVGETIRKKIIGHYVYYGINGNYSSVVKYYKYVKYTWYYTLRKRGKKNKIKYPDFLRIWNYLNIPKSKLYVNIW